MDAPSSQNVTALLKLRELILDFAVRGRLSERDPADELHPDWQKLPLCLDAFDDGEDLDRLPPQQRW